MGRRYHLLARGDSNLGLYGVRRVQQTFLAEKAEGKASMAIFAHYV